MNTRLPSGWIVAMVAYSGASSQGRARAGIVALMPGPYGPTPVRAGLRDPQADVLRAALGESEFDYHAEQIRSHREDWAPLLKSLKKAL